jgi:hypothetical protein
MALEAHLAGDQHLQQALQQLAWGDGSLQGRLAAAAECLVPLQEEAYAPEIKHRIRVLLGHLTHDGPPHAPGIHAATSLLNDEQCKRFMDHIIDIAVAGLRLSGADRPQQDG